MTPEARRELLRRLLEKRAAGVEEPIEIPVSSQQARLWVAYHLDPDDPSQNLRTELRIEGALDVDALDESFAGLVDEHDQLRATFHAVEGRPVARIATGIRPEVERIDLTRVADEERETEVERRVLESASRPFDLERGPLIRMTVLSLSPSEFVVVLTTHHIICDAWSMDLLLQGLLEGYERAGAVEPPRTRGVSDSYASFARRQAETLAGPAGAEMASFWRQRLAGFAGAPLLPHDHERPPGTQMASRRLAFGLAPELTEGIGRLGRSRGVTTYMVLFAALFALLHRLTGARDLVVGTPVANRQDESWERIVGYFVNLLPIRVELDGDATFSGVLSAVRRQVLDAQAHQELPVHKLAEAAGLRPAGLVRGLFQHVAAPSHRLDTAGLTITTRPIDLRRTHHEISLTTWIEAQGRSIGRPAGILEYSSDLFEPATAERFITDLESTLRAVVEDPDGRLRDLPVSPAWSRPTPDTPPPRTPVVAKQRAADRGTSGGRATSGDSTSTLDALATIWGAVLELDDVSPYDNFLDVGGDSLLAMQVIDRAEAELGVRMAPADLFTQTLTQLAASLEARRG